MLLLSKLVTALISPFGSALLVALLALLCAVRSRRRLAFGLGAGAVAWVWLWATPVVGKSLRMHLESGFPPLRVEALPAAAVAVVLGGAIAAPGDGRPYAQLHEGSSRVWQAARLYHAGKAPLLLLSGGGRAASTATSEAQAMAMLLGDLGVPGAAQVLEEDSRNTAQNAAFSAALLKQRSIQRVLLVTSAMHMARAMAEFEAAGLAVVPVAVDHGGSLAWDDWAAWMPNAGSLDESGRAIKEALGRCLPRPSR